MAQPDENLRVAHQARGADARDGEQMKESGLAERELLDQITSRRLAAGPLLSEAAEGAFDLPGLDRAGCFLAYPAGHFAHANT